MKEERAEPLNEYIENLVTYFGGCLFATQLHFLSLLFIRRYEVGEEGRGVDDHYVNGEKHFGEVLWFVGGSEKLIERRERKCVSKKDGQRAR